MGKRWSNVRTVLCPDGRKGALPQGGKSSTHKRSNLVDEDEEEYLPLGSRRVE
ncbi:hypothetical protein HAX54_037474, partial [Datura stramonium]|nr:hypothetical protein [Datura stramonium]